LTDDNKISKLSIIEIFLKGSIVALIVAMPSIFAFLLSWAILDDLIKAIIIGAVVHFVAMGFSLRISKKLLVKT